MAHELLNQASDRLRQSSFEVIEALRLLREYEKKATRVCDAFAHLDRKSMNVISQVEETAEQLRVLSEQVLTMGVVITPCPWSSGE